jgi:type II secretory pathway component PulK
MKLSTLEKKINTNIPWGKDLSEEEKVEKQDDNVSYVSLEKLQAEHGDQDTIIRTNESFNSELYTSGVKEKSLEYTVKRIQEIIEEDVVKPLGTEFTFTKISQDVATTFLNRDPLKQIHNEETIASLLDYGVLRSQFPHMFPKEKLPINGLETTNHPEFRFRTNILAKDIFEREHLKPIFTNLKRDNGTLR